METHRQVTDGPDPDLTRRLADLCKADPARFSALVRHHDALVRAGAESAAVWETLLEE